MLQLFKHQRPQSQEMEPELTRDSSRTLNYLVCHCFGLILGMDNKNSLTILNVGKTLTRFFNSLINGLILHDKCTGMKSFCKALGLGYTVFCTWYELIYN